MRCREVDVLWDEMRGETMPSLRQAVVAHLKACPPCQELYGEYEGLACCLSLLETPEPACNLAQRVLEHIAQLNRRYHAALVPPTSIVTPIGRLYVGYKQSRIAFVGIDGGEAFEDVRKRVEHRLRRPVESGEAPPWLGRMIQDFFKTWHVDRQRVDLSDLTPFEQAALEAAARIPPGETRSYAWVARQIGKPRAARAVGQAMARNPVALIIPCHRVVDSSGALHNYGYGIEMKARLLQLEGYRR